jgi:hypothetical protein
MRAVYRARRYTLLSKVGPELKEALIYHIAE